jgi:hypothetical protein
VSGHNSTVGESTTTIESATGAAIGESIGAVFVVNVGNGMLYGETNGTAGSDSFPIPPGAYYEFKGRQDELQSVQLYASPSTLVGFMYRRVYQ